MGGVVNHPDMEVSRRHLVDLRLRLERSLNMNYADGRRCLVLAARFQTHLSHWKVLWRGTTSSQDEVR